MDTARRNIAILATGQALGLAANSTVFTIGSLAALQLAENKAHATLPMTCWVLGNAVAALPVSWTMKRLGRPAGFALGAFIGILGVTLGVVALYVGSLLYLGAGMLLFGIYAAGAQHYRYAAAESAAEADRSQAISLVLAGGVVGGLVGPEVSKWTVDLFSVRFVGGYVAAIVYLALAGLIAWGLRVPPPPDDERRQPGRPLSVVMAQPAFVVAVAGSAIGYGVMNVLMMATPLVMSGCGHSFGSTAFVMQWHIVGMFAPSFVTGGLIRRFGAPPVMLAGVVGQSACIAVALAGVDVAHFWFALVLLGVGWNFLYVGGTALLTEAYAPAERAKSQAVNELIIAATLTLSSSTSGWLVARNGWPGPNYAAVPLVLAAGLAIAWLMARRRRVAAAGSELPA